MESSSERRQNGTLFLQADNITLAFNITLESQILLKYSRTISRFEKGELWTLLVLFFNKFLKIAST